MKKKNNLEHSAENNAVAENIWVNQQAASGSCANANRVHAHRFVISVCIVALSLGICAILSSCSIFGGSSGSLFSSEPQVKKCSDFDYASTKLALNDPCGYGVGEGFEYDDNITASAEEQNLVGDEAALYIARAKLQDLKRIYSDATTYCQKKFPSDVDLCKGYALKILFKGRELAYYNDINPNVYPSSDEEFLTAEFQGYYDELSPKTKEILESEKYTDLSGLQGRLVTAEEVRAEKAQFVEAEIQKYYQKSAPIGESDPTLEPLVIAYFKKLNPELKLKTIVFDEKWDLFYKNTYTEYTNASSPGDTVREVGSTIAGKDRIAAVSVELPNEKDPFVLRYIVVLKMDNEGGGVYGEPYCDRLVPISPISHKLDLLSKKAFEARDSVWNDKFLLYRSKDITYDNRQRLYEYHNVDVYLPIKP